MIKYIEQTARCNRDNMICTDEIYYHYYSCKDGYISIPSKDNKYFNME